MHMHIRYGWQRKMAEPTFIDVAFNYLNCWKVKLMGVCNIHKCSGSTIVGIGSPDPPQFVYDDDDYHDVFLSGKLQVVYLSASSSQYISEALSLSLISIKKKLESLMFGLCFKL